MTLSHITVENFRNHRKKKITFSADSTLILGANTAGKTNIIEAISLLSTGKSFRTRHDQEMISWGSEISRVNAMVTDVNLEVVLTIGSIAGQKAPKKRYLVNKIPRRLFNFMGNMPTVLFWPEDLELVTDSPALRRRYLNTVLSQVDREYRRNILSYERGLRQRNKILYLISEGKAGRSQLIFWNQLLIKAGDYITKKRSKYIDFVNNYELDEFSSRYTLFYDKSVISQSRLDQYKEEEIQAHVTLVGPQRDDFSFLIKSAPRKKDINLTYYGSRGEQRMGVLWLKLAELEFIRQKLGTKPLLLLDDIFSEFDEKLRKIVVMTIKEHQSVITSADKDIEVLIKEIDKEHNLIRL